MGITDFVPPDQYDAPGSSDIGNVSHVCPTQYVELALDGEETVLVHDESALKLVNSEAAYQKMDQTMEAFVMSAARIAEDETLKAEIQKEFYERTRE